MQTEEKIERLMLLGYSEEMSTMFFWMYEEMKLIDSEEAEEQRVEHAREMSKPKP